MNNLLKNPYIHGLIAEIYIIAFVLGVKYFGKPNTPDTPLDSIFAISLFVFSATIIAYLFLGESFMLFLSGEKKKSTTYFFKTVFAFAVSAIIVLGVLKLL